MCTCPANAKVFSGAVESVRKECDGKRFGTMMIRRVGVTMSSMVSMIDVPKGHVGCVVMRTKFEPNCAPKWRDIGLSACAGTESSCAQLIFFDTRRPLSYLRSTLLDSAFISHNTCDRFDFAYCQFVSRSVARRMCECGIANCQAAAARVQMLRDAGLREDYVEDLIDLSNTGDILSAKTCALTVCAYDQMFENASRQTTAMLPAACIGLKAKCACLDCKIDKSCSEKHEPVGCCLKQIESLLEESNGALSTQTRSWFSPGFLLYDTHSRHSLLPHGIECEHGDKLPSVLQAKDGALSFDDYVQSSCFDRTVQDHCLDLSSDSITFATVDVDAALRVCEENIDHGAPLCAARLIAMADRLGEKKSPFDVLLARKNVRELLDSATSSGKHPFNCHCLTRYFLENRCSASLDFTFMAMPLNSSCERNGDGIYDIGSPVMRGAVAESLATKICTEFTIDPEAEVGTQQHVDTIIARCPKLRDEMELIFGAFNFSFDVEQRRFLFYADRHRKASKDVDINDETGVRQMIVRCNSSRLNTSLSDAFTKTLGAGSPIWSRPPHRLMQTYEQVFKQTHRAHQRPMDEFVQTVKRSDKLHLKMSTFAVVGAYCFPDSEFWLAEKNGDAHAPLVQFIREKLKLCWRATNVRAATLVYEGSGEDSLLPISYERAIVEEWLRCRNRRVMFARIAANFFLVNESLVEEANNFIYATVALAIVAMCEKTSETLYWRDEEKKRESLERRARQDAEIAARETEKRARVAKRAAIEREAKLRERSERRAEKRAQQKIQAEERLCKKRERQEEERTEALRRRKEEEEVAKTERLRKKREEMRRQKEERTDALRRRKEEEEVAKTERLRKRKEQKAMSEAAKKAAVDAAAKEALVVEENVWEVRKCKETLRSYMVREAQFDFFDFIQTPFYA